MTIRTVILGVCIALSFTVAAEVPEDNGPFILVCKWDDTGEHTTVQIFGPGRHLLPGAIREEVIESHKDDRIVQRSWVLKGNSEERYNLGTEADPDFIYWSHTVDRYTGRLEYFDGSVGVRMGNCRKAKEKLF